MQRLFIYLALGYFITFFCNGQSRVISLDASQKQTIKIDGQLDSTEWSHISVLDPILNKWPIDTGYALQQSNIRVTYDDQFLYVSAINHQKHENTIVQSLLRDSPPSHWGSEGFTVILDPTGLQASGFLFGVNAGGAQMEATISQGSNGAQFDQNWDNKWYSSVQRHEEYWVVEMAIPYNTLRFDPKATNWRINFIRHDMHNNVISTWSHIPLAFPGIDLGYTGAIKWEIPPKASKRNIAIIPYTAGLATRDYEDGAEDLSGSIGLDAKIAVTSSLNLDLTLNPDFSNVAVDQQQTNLTQFSLFFPEQRPFFLENSDLFSNYGTWGINPFFSRTIGLHEGETVPINFGARLSGNLTKKLRVGIMDIQTRATEELPASNYFVGSFQQQVLSRSRVKLLLTNRSSVSQNESETLEEYNRSAGGEFDYISTDGKLRATAKYHLSDDPQANDENSYMTLGSSYNNGKYYGAFFFNRVGQNYQPDMGFVPTLNYYDPVADSSFRVGFQRINGWVGYIHRPKNSAINMIDINPWVVRSTKLNGDKLLTDAGLWATMRLKSRVSFEVNLMRSEVSLQAPLDFTGEYEALPVDTYVNTLYRFVLNSDDRKAVSGSASIGYGEFFTGDRVEWVGSLNFRQSPWGNFAINYTMNKLNLGETHGNTILHLLGPSASISFANNIFWTTFLQYNTQADNFNVNSRFQWRFKPMSDFFIVYGENYDTSGLLAKNRSLVLKLSYWFNL